MIDTCSSSIPTARWTRAKAMPRLRERVTVGHHFAWALIHAGRTVGGSAVHHVNRSDPWLRWIARDRFSARFRESQSPYAAHGSLRHGWRMDLLRAQRIPDYTNFGSLA